MTTVGLIDVSHIFRSAWHATADEPLSTAFNYTIKSVLRISQASRLDHVVVCLDTPPYNRKNIFPEYKANRDKPDPAMFEQMKRVYSKLDAMGIKMSRAASYEADDIIATLTKHAKAQGWKVEIFSADKDLMQLVDLDCKMISTRDGTVFDYAAVKEKYVAPNKLGDYLALMGDASDNIPGCPGVGGKTAAKLLAEHGDLEGILSATIAGKLGERLKEFSGQILLSRTLVELQKDAPIVWGELFDDAPKTDPEVEMQEDVDEDSALADPESGPTAGDMLVSGAIVKQAIESGEMQAVAPPPPCAPKMTPVPATPVSSQAIAKTGADTGIQLRPGLTLNSDQFRLMEAMAHRFHKSGMYVRKFDSVDAIFTIMELGLELDMSPQLACQQFHMIEGRPTMAAHLLIARAEASPNCEWIECTEDTAESVTYSTKKRRGSGNVLTFTYTMKDAERAGMLTGGSSYNWKKRPREMLRKTCGSQMARRDYPGACAGIYSMEEMGHHEDEAVA